MHSTEPNSPKDGDIWVKNGVKVVWKSCEDCGIFRWTNLYNKTKFCQKCSMKRAHNISLSMTRGPNATYNINENYFSIIDNEKKAYILGFLMGDGSITNDLSGFRINLQEDDVNILEKIRTNLSSNHPIKSIVFEERIYKGKKFATSYQKKYEIWSTTLIKDLVRHGVVPRKSQRESLPEVPIDLQRHLIRGIVDSDGGLHKASSDGSWALYIEGSEQLLNSCKEVFLRELEVWFPPKCVRWGNGCYEFRVNGVRARVIVEWLYRNSNIYLDRKYKLFEQFSNEFDLEKAKIRAKMNEKELSSVITMEYFEKPINHNVFNNIDKESSAWALGFLAGRGSIVNNKRSGNLRPSIRVISNEIDVLEAFKTALNSGHDIFESSKEKRITITSPEICRDLLQHFGSNSKREWHLPDVDEFNSHVMRGFFDANGLIEIYDDVPILIIKSQPGILVSFCNFIQKLDVQINFGYTKTNKLFKVEIIGKDNVRKVLDILYDGSVFFSKRNKDKYLQIVRGKSLHSNVGMFSL